MIKRVRVQRVRAMKGTKQLRQNNTFFFYNWYFLQRIFCWRNGHSIENLKLHSELTSSFQIIRVLFFIKYFS